MRNILVVSIVAFLVAVPAFAKSVEYKACAVDHKPVVLNVTLNDAMLAHNPEIEKHLAVAFALAAYALPSEELQGNYGYLFFVKNLSAEDRDAIDEMSPPVVLEGSCDPTQF